MDNEQIVFLVVFFFLFSSIHMFKNHCIPPLVIFTYDGQNSIIFFKSTNKLLLQPNLILNNDSLDVSLQYFLTYLTDRISYTDIC